MSWLLDSGWWVLDAVVNYAKENPVKTLIFGYLVARAFGTTVQTGWKGVLFSFGRAKKELEPGFHFLIPLVQRVRKTPVRAITLHLPKQRITTADGLVFEVEANVIYRVLEPMKALVLIDDLRRGCEAVLPVIVQDLLRGKTRSQLQERKGLDEEFTALAAEKLNRWGVTVEQAGFMTIAPTKKTLRLTQLGQLSLERERMLDRYRHAGLSPDLALSLLGTERKAAAHSAARYRGRSRQIDALRKAYEKVILAEEHARIVKEWTAKGMAQGAPIALAAAEPALREVAAARARRFSRMSAARRPRRMTVEVAPQAAEDPRTK